ncbi:MaoC/PaaZ C-terminal domain-containing protein [Gordonia sp. ABSL1-1]|uniref:MaoC/PaaZ C-terminal domain-containing protein n=1 Tax=Gordonia sp. ABSL1-1 TaxID=3053923 RepID=UPI0025735016|nr:MaoC/PaaZ C-terminal domain-containing protein [Gordonia sp. ABSL1-1]MDL9935290.1 MaoC/PaaZ C-terminal domain-containing protein [Gordonia sp. ABSL1-1]
MISPQPPTASARIYADDLQVGRRYELDQYTITEDELVAFASAWDPQDFHIDGDAARSGAFDGLIASGIHTLAIYQRLAVTKTFATWSVIAGRRLDDVRFLRPVRPDDTLTGTIDIVDVVLEPARGRGLVITDAELVNQYGDPVLRARVEAYVRTRP